MAEIREVLLTVPFPKPQMEAMVQALAPAKVYIADAKDTKAIGEALQTAEVAILSGDINDQIMTGQHLRWVHCDHSGLTHSARPEVFERGIAVTGSAGRSAPTLAEHAILFMLALTYDVTALIDLQRGHQWGGLPGYNDRRGLFGKTAGIVGVGHTGKALAERLKAMGMHVLGYRRRAEAAACVDTMYVKDKGDSLMPLLEQSDYVILTTQLSDETHHMIGHEQLGKMKNSAYLVNMCRGGVVDEKALIRALKDGQIAGAGIDTTEVEPLPKESELWDAPNLMITPHNTPTVPDRWQRSLEIITENIRRYRGNEPLQNQITLRDVYTVKR